MKPTPYNDINALISELQTQLQNLLGDKLVGLYLEGSLVIGDFDAHLSDIDLLAALGSVLNEEEFAALEKMHTDFAQKHPDWNDRIEVCYIAADALGKVKSETAMIANISPGEPFHRKESSKDWMINWYLTREKSLTLLGPSPKTIIEPITKQEFVEAVREHAKKWKEAIKDTENSRSFQAYAILAMCRAVYTSRFGEQLSKKAAALWAEKEFPEWAELVKDALKWREVQRDIFVDGHETYPETVRFVQFMIEQLK